MLDDKKLEFYFKHRAQIEEWAALRQQAQQAVDDALLGAVDALKEELGDLVQPSYQGTRIIKLRVPGHETAPTWVEMWWQRSTLLANWPNLILAVTPDKQFWSTREQIKGASRSVAAQHGLTKSSPQWWVWHGQLEPESEPMEPDEYAHYCVLKARAAWGDLQVPIARVLSSGSMSSATSEQ